jgi:uncharacterized membrane protein
MAERIVICAGVGCPRTGFEVSKRIIANRNYAWLTKNRHFTYLRTAEGETSGTVNEQRPRVKMFWGILLLILTPVFLFVRPISKAAALRDLLLVIWWAFILWLLITGMKESRPTDSK